MSQRTKPIDIHDFARRVERLCDFFIDRVDQETGKRDNSDLRVFQELRDEAADIQYEYTSVASETIDGLHDYMSGLKAAPKEEKK